MTMTQRRPLPNRRRAITFKVRLNGAAVFVTTGEYEDGTLGEVFVIVSRCGSTLRGVLDAWATQVSMSLQWGQPLEDIVESFLWRSFEPNGTVEGHPDIVRATSVIDLVVRILAIHYCGARHLANAPTDGLETPPEPSSSQQPASVEEPPHRPVPKHREGNEGRVPVVTEDERLAAQFAAEAERTAKSNTARLKGCTGESCPQCHSFDVVMDGKCAVCLSCHSTVGGCS